MTVWFPSRVDHLLLYATVDRVPNLDFSFSSVEYTIMREIQSWLVNSLRTVASHRREHDLEHTCRDDRAGGLPTREGK